MQYRTLNEGEIIKHGDEVEVSGAWGDEVKWVPAKRIGEAAPSPISPAHRVYRRLVGTHLFRELVRAAADGGGRADIITMKVWQATPWMVNTYTGSICNHGRYADINDWCRENFGDESHPISGQVGKWHCGSATIMGWTWMGFAEEEMMKTFVEKWGEGGGAIND